jgi:hypothetical protein
MSMTKRYLTSLDLIGTEVQSILALRFRSRKGDHVCTERMGQFDTHVTETANADDAHLLTFAEPCAGRSDRRRNTVFQC